MILVLGDCHASWPQLIAAIDQAISEHGVTTVIQVGDFGFFPALFPRLLQAMQGQRFAVPVHAIDGNHEDHAWLRQQADAGAFERWASDYNLIVHRRAETATIEGITVGFLGGALHADREQHGSPEEGTTNWVTDQEADQTAQEMAAQQVELLITHSCPHSIGVGMEGSAALISSVELFVRSEGFDSGPLEDCGEPGLSRLWRRLRRRPKVWAFGHFHRHQVSRVGGTMFRCVGSCDGTDRRSTPAGHLLDPKSWAWTVVDL